MEHEDSGPELLAEDRAALAEVIASLRESVAEEPEPRPEHESSADDGLKWGWRATADRHVVVEDDDAGDYDAAAESRWSDSQSTWLDSRAQLRGSDRSPAPGRTRAKPIDSHGDGDAAEAGDREGVRGTRVETAAAHRSSADAQWQSSRRPAERPVHRTEPASSSKADYRWHNAAIVILLILCVALAAIAFL